jgi:hypothetical protein
MLDRFLIVRVFLDNDPVDSEGFAHFYFSYDIALDALFHYL